MAERINNLGIMLTSRCDLKCEHCMFSCTNRGKDMTADIIEAIYRFIKTNKIYSVNVYGGEPFLNMDLFELMFNWIYSNSMMFYVSSNGTFLTSPKRKNRVLNILSHLSLNDYLAEGLTNLRISNTDFHKNCRSDKCNKEIERLHWLLKDKDFYEHPQYFDCTGKALLHVDDWNGEGPNPSGRAINLQYNTDCCSCSITSDNEEYFDDIQIRSNGDIAVCTTCKGCTIGNILDHPTIEDLSNNLKKIKEHFALAHRICSDTRMYDFCETCSEYNIKDFRNPVIYSRSRQVVA